MPSLMRKSRSTMSLQSNSFASDPYWSGIKELSQDDKKSMEKSWNQRHQLHFSRMNQAVNPCFRDYFDRRREEPESLLGVKPAVRWRPVWQLTVGHQNKDADRSNAGSFRNSTPPTGVTKRPTWDDHHHVTVSANNTSLHEGSREYFSRIIQPQSQRLVPLRKKGIMKHQLPHAMHGNPDGCDDELTSADLMVRDDDQLPPLPGPPETLLSASASSFLAPSAVESSSPSGDLGVQ
jgi:hypothetical protein